MFTINILLCMYLFSHLFISVFFPFIFCLSLADTQHSDRSGRRPIHLPPPRWHDGIILETKNTSRYGPFGPFVKCINNLESKYLGEKMARHGSLENLERPHSDAIIPLKPRKKETELSDHIQFLITEKTMPKTSSSDETSRELAADEGDIISDGK